MLIILIDTFLQRRQGNKDTRLTNSKGKAWKYMGHKYNNKVRLGRGDTISGYMQFFWW